MGKRQFNTLNYLFFLTIVIGAFASIAQNDYGVILMAIGCFGFSFIYLLKLYNIYTTEKPLLPKSLLVQEYISMAIIMLLFGFRALRIQFTFVEIIFVICSLFMVYIYLRYIRYARAIYKENTTLFYCVNLLYVAIILFFTSLSFTFLNQSISVALGAISFAFSVGFLVWYFWKGPTTVFKEDNVNIFQEVFQYLNLSPNVLTMILLISFYMGMYQTKLLPPIYTGEMPVRFIELQEKAIKGDEKGIDGSFKHEIYWDEYQKFLSQMEERDKSK